MKSYKSCLLRYLWQHQFDLPFNVQLNVHGTRSHRYERKCERCGLHQKISVTLGFHFLEEESGGK